MNPATKLIKEIQQILATLPHGSAPKIRYFPWVTHDISSRKIDIDIRIGWFTRINYEICAESWLTRFLCRMAHGDQCGSNKYLALRESIRDGDKKIMTLVKESGLDNFEKKSESTFEMTHQWIDLQYRLELSMDVALLPPVAISARELILQKLRDDNDMSYKKMEDLEVTYRYKKLLLEELGVEWGSISLYC